MIGWAALGLGAAALPFVAERLKPTVATVRDQAEGELIALNGGVTHIRWSGPPDGPVAVCIHGLTTPSFVWQPIADGLAARGWRVLRYDLYGRGYSDRPPGAQDRGFFVAQLNELLAHQGIDGPVTVLGYSMGGAIATVFASADPSRVRRVILLAPAGLGHDLGWLDRATRRVPGLGDWLMLAFGGRTLRRGALAQPEEHAAIARRQAAETRLRGYLPAVLSSQRHLLARTLDDDHRCLAAAGTDVTAIWGEDDDVIPLICRDRLAALNPGARQVTVPKAGHALAYTHTAEVLAAIDE